MANQLKDSPTPLLINDLNCKQPTNIYPISNVHRRKEFWSSPEEEKLAISELRAALEKQRNDKDYHKKIHEHVLQLIDELESNENFQKMITGMLTPPVFIGENSDSQDELLKLLEEYDEKENSQRIKELNLKKTKVKRINSKRRNSIKNKTIKRV